MKFWQDKTKQLKKEFDGVEIQNLNTSIDILKHCHYISMNF